MTRPLRTVDSLSRNALTNQIFLLKSLVQSAITQELGRKSALKIGPIFPPNVEISERMPCVEVQENAEVATNVMRLELVYEASPSGPHFASLGSTGLKW